MVLQPAVALNLLRLPSSALNLWKATFWICPKRSEHITHGMSGIAVGGGHWQVNILFFVLRETLNGGNLWFFFQIAKLIFVNLFKIHINPIPLHQWYDFGVVGSYVFMQCEKFIYCVPPILHNGRAALHLDYIILKRAETVVMQNTLRICVGGQIYHSFVFHNLILIYRD